MEFYQLLNVFQDETYAQKVSEYYKCPILPFSRYFISGTADDFSYRFMREKMFSLTSKQKLFNSVASVKSADTILMPIDWNSYIFGNGEIERHYRNLAEKYGLPLIITHLGDRTSDIKGRNVIVLRTSKFKSDLTKNEIICPPVVDDLSEELEMPLLSKSPEPSIGFVGMTRKGEDNKNSFNLLKYGKRDLLLSLFYHVKLGQGAKRSGQFFRQKVLSLLGGSRGLQCDFIERGHWGLEKFSRQKVVARAQRDDYLQNIKRNQLSLSIRGAGNFSLRFYEILSAGRIPILIDTDCPLPSENTINYKEFCVVIDWRRLNSASEFLCEWYNSISEEELKGMQRNAKKAFLENLRFDVFSRRLFKEIVPDLLISRNS